MSAIYCINSPLEADDSVLSTIDSEYSELWLPVMA